MKMIAGMENMCFWLVCCILVLFPSHSSACKAACYPPANLQAELSDASIYQLNNSTTLEQSVLAGRCFALCLKRYKDIIRPSEFYQPSGQWLSVSYDSLSQDCTVFQKVTECKSGCILRSVTGNRSECRQKCYDSCLLECNSTCSNNFNSTCMRRCRRAPCNLGCIEYAENIQSNHTGGELPITPGTYLQATTSSSTTGIIELTLEGSSSAINSSLVHSFIIRLQNQNAIRYLWVPHLNNSIRLDVREYSCKDIQLSYAPVNMNGLAIGFSPILDYCVRGEYIYPDQLTSSDLSYQYYEDFRDGYLGNVVINITWNSSRIALDYATHYEVILEPFPPSHLSVVTHFFINKNSTWFLLQASAPSLPPVFRSKYLSSFIVHPVVPGAMLPRQNILRPQLLLDTPNMSLECVPLMSSSTLTVSIHWTLANDSYVLDTIQNFRVKITHGDTKYDDITLHKQDGKFDYSADIGPFPLYHPNTNEGYTIKVIASKDDSYFWRKVPETKSCVINGTWPALPPSPVLCINVTKLNKNKYSITWCPPNETYGSLLAYHISFGVNNFINTRENETEYIIEIFEECKSFKIRSENEFGLSEWSQVHYVGNHCYSSLTAAGSMSSSHYITSTTISRSSSYYTVIASTTTTASNSSYYRTISSTLTITSQQSSSITTFTATTPSLAPSLNSINHALQLNTTMYFLLASIALLLIVIILTSIILLIVCLKYKKTAITSSIDLQERNKNSLQDSSWRKASTDSTSSVNNNKTASENIYSTIPVCSTPV